MITRMLRGLTIVPLVLVFVSQSAGAAPGDCRLIAGADTPEDPTDDVEVCELQTYFHRAATPLGNLGSTAVGGGNPTFDAEPPTSPAPAAYATVLGRLIAYSPQYRPTFEGTFTGNIDTLRVEMYMTSPVYQNVGGSYPLIFELRIDGEPIILENPSAGGEQDIPLVPTSEDGVYRMAFGIRNLYEAMGRFGLEEGPDVEHTVQIWMTALYFGDGNSVHWFDSESRPSGIYFNPASLTGVVQYDALQY